LIHLFKGLRDNARQEERLSNIPSAYNYRLRPPAKNITTEEEEVELFPTDYATFLENYGPLKKAKGKYLVPKAFPQLELEQINFYMCIKIFNIIF